jgi:serine/threonine protein kinase
VTISHRDSSPRVGQTIAGKFVIEAVVAVGGIGTVYRARQLGLDRVVALKLLREEFARDEDFLERFKREARAASRLEHPNSVRVLDFGQHDDGSMLYLAMEYVEGRTLYDVIRQDAPLSDERIVDILSQVLAAVGVAHDMGVVHRDLKPENIMIIRGTSDEGEHAELVKVLDFGIASLGNAPRDAGVYAEGPRMTKRGLIVGTPEYMAPEQADGRADRRSDIYSLGVVLYQMMTGRLPFRGDSPLTVAVKHITEALELPSQIAAVNPKLEAVCVRALGKTPDERYASAREMRSALRAAINLAPSRASAPQVLITGADSQSGPLFGTRRTPLGQPSSGVASGVYGRRRHASLVVGLALATLFAAALGARSWWVKSHRVPPAPDRAAGVVASAPTGTTTTTPTPTPTLTEGASEGTSDEGQEAPAAARRNKAAPARDTRDKARRTAHATAAPRASGKGTPGTSPVVGAKGGSPADDAAGAKTPAAKAGAAVTAPTAITPPVAPAPPDLGHASVSITAITSTSAIPSANIRAALSRSPLVRCYREALHAAGAAATGTAVLHLKIDIAGYVTSTELEGAQFLPGVKPCVEKATRGVRVKDVDTGDATADVTLTFACPP